MKDKLLVEIPRTGQAGWNAGVRVRIKKDVEGAGNLGTCYATLALDNGMKWALVLFDGEEDPTTFKVSCLEEAVQTRQEMKG